MDALECLTTRMSVRSFLPDPVPKDILESLVDAGRLAPTANNTQPWDFIVVTDEAKRKRLAELMTYGKFLAESPAAIVVSCRATANYVEDGSAAVENIMLAGWAQGVGSCWVAGVEKPYGPEILEMFNAPADHKLVAVIALGYPAAKGERIAKRSLNDVAHWEKW